MGGVNGTTPKVCTSNTFIPHKSTETTGTNSKGEYTKNKPGRPTRAAPSEVSMETQEHRKPEKTLRLIPSEVTVKMKYKGKQ